VPDISHPAAVEPSGVAPAWLPPDVPVEEGTWYDGVLVSNRAVAVGELCVSTYEVPEFEYSPDGLDAGESLEVELTLTCPGDRDAVEVGSILVDRTILRVEEVEWEGLVGRIAAVPAGLDELFLDGELRRAVPIEMESEARDGWTFGATLYDDGATSLALEGMAHLEPTVFLGLCLWCDTRLELGVVVDASFAAMLLVDSEGAVDRDGELPIAGIPVGEFVFFVGPFPVHVGLSLGADVVWSVDASAQVHGVVGAQAETRVSAGGRLTSCCGWQPLDSTFLNLGPLGPSLDLEGTLSARAGLRLSGEAAVYGGVGVVGMAVEPYGQIMVSTGAECGVADWSLSTGVDSSAYLEVHIRFLFIDIHHRWEVTPFSLGPWSVACGVIDLPEICPEEPDPFADVPDAVIDSDVGEPPWWEAWPEASELLGDLPDPAPTVVPPPADLALSDDGSGLVVVDQLGGVEVFGSLEPFGSFYSPGLPILSVVGTPSDGGGSLLAASGSVVPLGDATFLPPNQGELLSGAAVDLTAGSEGGLLAVTFDGDVLTFGPAVHHGDVPLEPGEYAVSIAGVIGGYLVATTKGRVHTFGDVAWHGHLYPASELPVIDMAASEDGSYVLLSGLGVYGFGPSAPDDLFLEMDEAPIALSVTADLEGIVVLGAEGGLVGAGPVAAVE